MNLMNFSPKNDLERSIIEADKCAITIKDLLYAITRSLLFVSSKAKVEQDGRGFVPLLLEGDGHPPVAAFSSLERPGLHSEVASYVLQMTGRDFVLRLPPEYGVIINPGYAHQFIITPNVASDLRYELSAK